MDGSIKDAEPVALGTDSTGIRPPLEGADNGEEIINWEEEATAIINDVKTHVAEIDIAKKLPSNESHIYMNICTFEGASYCIHVSSIGFRIVSKIYDTIDEGKEEVSEDDEVFETPYALLDKISPGYVESFGNQLCKQLLQLQRMRTEFKEEDEEGLEEEDEEEED
ncbi:GSK3-beta interaction protein [Stomoxys calcitrans]|uniref:GSKIP domain-containing protein n=1 Tax=Stomoxys calcitrans TaxID=35570 RepID=A0A1I8P605_STOCA|nr:GSK3-beta interaction protein [Stomoxys calcitrans]